LLGVVNHLFRPQAIAGHQVIHLGRLLGVIGQLLQQAWPQSLQLRNGLIAIGGTAEQRQRLSDRLSSTKTLQHQLQGIEGQHPAGGPFASKQADQSTRQLFHLVLTH